MTVMNEAECRDNSKQLPSNEEFNLKFDENMQFVLTLYNILFAENESI